MSHIIMAGGIKGGSGKSTIATNLAVLFSSKGDTLLVDADDQGTASDFSLYRNNDQDSAADYTTIKLSGQSVRTQLLNMKSKYKYIVIDTGGRDTSSQRAAISIANIMLIPFLPRSFDVWTLDRVNEMLNEMIPTNPDLKVFSFLNRADHIGTDNDDASIFLKESSHIHHLKDIKIGSRKSFSNASADGLSVVEYKPKDEKAIHEINALFDFILKSL